MNAQPIFPKRRVFSRLFQIGVCLIFIFSLASNAFAQSTGSASAAHLGWEDDFSKTTLSPTWYWVNEDPAGWSLSENPGYLRIYTVPGATGSQNLLLRSVGPGNFAFQTHLFFEPTSDFQFAGLVIYQDAENFLQFGRAFCGVEGCFGNAIYFDKIIAGAFEEGNFATPVSNISETFLRLELQDQKLTAYYSEDGITWQDFGSHSIPASFVINGVGLTSSQNGQDPENPIPADFDYFAVGPLSPKLVGNWDEVAVLKPSVIKDASGYKMWFDGMDLDGNSQVGLAQSKDGKTWMKYPGNPILDGEPGQWDAYGEHAPFVMKEGNQYKMWYEGSDGSVRQLGYATSPDGIHWTKYAGNPVLRAGPEGFDQEVAGHGTVLYEDGLYKLWYHAIGDQGIIIAYATSPDGITWTKEGSVLLGRPGEWDEMLWGPSVLNVGGTYLMWYTAAGPVYPPSIGLAESTDGANWTRVSEEPVLMAPNGSDSIGDPTVIFDGGLFKMWYGNFSDRRIYYTESADGSNWTTPVAALFPGIDMQPSHASPFFGYWQATEVNGSDLSLFIAGGPSGPFEVTIEGSRLDFCGGEAGVLRGRGSLIAEDPNLLDASLHLTCYTSDTSFDVHIVWRYDPATNTLTYTDPNPVMQVWHRLNQALPEGWRNFLAHPDQEWVEGWGYAEGSTVSLRIFDQEGTFLYGSTAVASYPEWAPESAWVDFPLDFDLKAGDHLWMSDGSIVKDLVVTSLAITDIDLEGKTVSGIAAPGSEVIIEYPAEPLFTVAADQDGNWSAALAGLTVGIEGMASQQDEDGDMTRVSFYIPQPTLIAFPVADQIFAYGWPVGSEVTLTIKDTDFTQMATVGPAPWGDLNDIMAYFDFGADHDLVPGDEVTLSGSGRELTYTIQAIAVTSVDMAEDTVSGTASEGAEVYAWVHGFGQPELVVPVTDGAWTADFGDAGIDLIEDMCGRAEIRDGLGSSTAVDWCIPRLNLRVNYGDDWVESFFEAGHVVQLTVTESDGSTVKAAAQFTTEAKDFWDGATGFQTNPEDWVPSRPDIQPGDWVKAVVDTGQTAQVQIGKINGLIDLASDSIEGTVDAPWFADPVQIECHSWGKPEGPEVMKYDDIIPNGEDMYACAWDPATEWDIQDNQVVGVGYFGPDGNWVANAYVQPFTLEANAGWMDSGSDVFAGLPVTITSTGEVATIADGVSTGPDGQENLCPPTEEEPACALDGYPYGSLVGKIGVDGEPFLIGSSLTFTPTLSGDLYLIVNDNEGTYEDNTGSFTVYLSK
ncbi:MAG: hypothetical protein M1281_05840 [Chloroflexi bacterium]|nr:hypothetical protein [Chloroflexota bacterium]